MKDNYGGSRKDEKREERVKLNKEFIEKKDMFYWIVMLVASLVLTFVWRAGDQSTLVNQISLVGSVSSILLALIAIGYAFFQTNDAGNENKLMLQTLHNIREEVQQLEEINESLGNVKGEFTDFKESTQNNNNQIMRSLDFLKENLNIDFIFQILKEKYGEELDDDTKQKIRESYSEKFEEKVKDIKEKNVMKVDSELQSEILHYIADYVERGQFIDERDLLEFLMRRNYRIDSYKLLLELEKLSEYGFVSFVKREGEDNILVMKTSKIGKVDTEDAEIYDSILESQ